MSRNYELYLHDILSAIDAIVEYPAPAVDNASLLWQTLVSLLRLWEKGRG